MTSHNEKIITVKYKGKTYTGNHSQLAEQFNISRPTFSSRLSLGWTAEEALGLRKRKVVRNNKRMYKRVKAFFLYKLKPTEVEHVEYNKKYHRSLDANCIINRCTTLD